MEMSKTYEISRCNFRRTTYRWKSHILYVRKKLSRSCEVLCKHKRYGDVITLKKVYYALFEAHLQYAIICWGSGNKTSLHAIEIIQNRAIRYLYRIPRYTRLKTRWHSRLKNSRWKWVMTVASSSLKKVFVNNKQALFGKYLIYKV